MHGIRRPNTRNNLISMAAGMVAFVLVFLFETLLNIKYKTMTQIPGDFQELYYASKLTGRDWSNFTNPPYVNVFSTLIYSLVFIVVKRGPIFLWQSFLLISTFFKCFPSFIATYISIKRYEINRVIAVMLGILCTLCLPGRSNYLTTQVFNVFLFWLLFWFVTEYLCNESKCTRKVFVVLITFTSFLYTLSALSNLTIFIVVILLLSLGYKSKKVNQAEFVLGLILTALFFLSTVFVMYIFERGVLPPKYNVYKVGETFQNISLRMSYELESLKTVAGWLGIFDVIFSMIWELSVYTFGIVPFTMAFIICSIKESKKSKYNFIIFSGLFLTVSLALSSLFKAITSGYHYAEMHIKHYSPYAGLFDINPYVCYLGPTILLFFAIISKKIKIKYKHILLASGVFLSSTLYLFFSVFFSTRNIPKYDIANCFSSNKSLFLSLISSNDIFGIIKVFIGIFLLILLVSIAITKSFDVKDCSVLFVLVFLFQYLMGYYSIDSGYRKEISNYVLIDSTYNLSLIMGEDFDKIGTIYYLGNQTPGFILQFALANNEVVLDAPDEDNESAFIVSSYSLLEMSQHVDVTEYVYCKSSYDDKNEYFYVKGAGLIDLFTSYGLSFNSAASEYYEYQNLNRIYKIALGRNIDAKGLEYWSEEISEGNVTYKEFIYGVLMGEEFMSKGYSHRDIVNKFYTLFYDPDLTDDEKYEPKYEDLKMLSKQLDEGVPFNLFIEGFFISENCVLDDLRWE